MASRNNEKNKIEKEMNLDVEKNASTPNGGRTPPLGEIAIEASKIVSRLEQVAEGLTLSDSVFNQSTVFLSLDKKSEEEILQCIQGLVFTDEEGEVSPITPLDRLSKFVITSHSLSAYCGSLDRHLLQKLSTRFSTDTARWLSQMFGFLDSAAFYHDDQLEGLVRVTRMILHYKFPRYLEDGALSYMATPPTIYSSVASPLGVVQHLCRQLGLPLSCVRPVPVNTHFGSQYTMDVSQLQRMLAEDISAGRVPLIVIGDAGTPITGHVDNISRLQELCKTRDIWLHLRGHNLAALALPMHQNNGHTPPVADSFTLPLGRWLGIPGLPMVTLYRLWDNSNSTPNNVRARQVGTSRESTLPLLAGLNNDHQGRRVLPLPLWVALQALGREGVHSRLKNNFLANERLCAAINVYRQIRILSQKPGGENGLYTISELLSKPSSMNNPNRIASLTAEKIFIDLLFETTASSVVFQFIPEPEDGKMLTRIPPYYDKLNFWLGQNLQIDAPQVPIDICEIENVGVVLRFCPFENTSGQQPTLEEIQSFVQCLEQQLEILRSTIQYKTTFAKLVEASPVLKLVELPEWAGLGGVRYVPEAWELLLTDQAKEELNNLNMALVDALQATDSAFSVGEGSDGLLCVRFGMLTPQSDVEELLNNVIKVGQSVEENSRVLDTMSEVVKKGIETATKDLQKENEERLWQEGILRHVPVVGTFVNWWSPKTKETGIKGRSLNLTQGIVESTENIYKYHMQVASGNAPPGTKSPPTPLVQTQVGGGHSRSSSHASSQGTPSSQISVGSSKSELRQFEMQGNSGVKNSFVASKTGTVQVLPGDMQANLAVTGMGDAGVGQVTIVGVGQGTSGVGQVKLEVGQLKQGVRHVVPGVGQVIPAVTLGATQISSDDGQEAVISQIIPDTVLSIKEADSTKVDTTMEGASIVKVISPTQTPPFNNLTNTTNS